MSITTTSLLRDSSYHPSRCCIYNLFDFLHFIECIDCISIFIAICMCLWFYICSFISFTHKYGFPSPFYSDLTKNSKCILVKISDLRFDGSSIWTKIVMLRLWTKNETKFGILETNPKGCEAEMQNKAKMYYSRAPFGDF